MPDKPGCVRPVLARLESGGFSDLGTMLPPVLWGGPTTDGVQLCTIMGMASDWGGGVYVGGGNSVATRKTGSTADDLV